MRHQAKGRKFNRVKKIRTALLRSLVTSLVLREKITTTEPKAKEIRPLIEKVITKAKADTLTNRRIVIDKIGQNKETISKLFGVIGPRFINRSGGYTRITKLGRRESDGSPMAIIEFV